ncbi:MAG: hypothetical protein IPK26_06205 [Planctomycetes bacterium]|nr:hypothetical protein [Planctomycetota bacterium]
MFERFIRLAKAKKALAAGRFEDAIQLTEDPWIARDRRAEDVRTEAVASLWRRAQQRHAAGDRIGAGHDVRRILAAGPHADAAALASRLDSDGKERREHEASARQVLEQARRLAEQGQLGAAAEQLAAAVARAPMPAEERALRAFVAERRQRAREAADRCRQALRDGRIEIALAGWQQASALADDAIDPPLQQTLVAAAGQRLADQLADRIAQSDLDGALAALRSQAGDVPTALEHTRVHAAAADLAAAIRRQLQADAEAGAAVSSLARAVAALPDPLPGCGAILHVAAVAWLQAQELRLQGRLTELAPAMRRAAEHLPSPALGREADRLEKLAAACAERLAGARQFAADGEPGRARAELTAILEDWPMHDEARAELAMLDQGAIDRDRRLQAAKAAARDGRLREACAQALALVVPGPSGEEARLLVKELRARIDLVQRGLDQVRVALHSRQASTIEGVRHCERRLAELAKVQVDHEETLVLTTALAAEIDGLERCERIQQDLDRRSWRAAGAAVAEVVALRPRLLAEDRLDARLLTIADRLARAAEESLAAGRLDEMEVCVSGFLAATCAGADLQRRAERLREAAAAVRTGAEAKVAAARAALAERDLAEAERLLEQARQSWTDCPPARKLADEVAALRSQAAALDRVEAFTSERDFAAAQQELGSLPPTPALLRTRIFDMKQNLMRAQGLDGAFLLRVDEGGEYLVLRGESVTIGNVREGRTDLPILAAIAGRHARIQRSMSFHGGMQDTVVAEGGDLLVSGRKIDRHALRTGDRFQLGSSLAMQYLVPSSRSLTATLVLQGGFQVAGTDRVLLLKDRGRDGRILIGAAKDAHVRVPGAQGEIEIFATKDGQIRVRVSGQGTIDGKPFADEHPVSAGAVVAACGVGFVLLPWQRVL